MAINNEEKKSSFTTSRHLNQVNKVTITNIGTDIISVVFLPKMFNLDLIIRKHQTNPN